MSLFCTAQKNAPNLHHTKTKPMNSTTNTWLNTSHQVNVDISINPMVYILFAIVGALLIALNKLL